MFEHTPIPIKDFRGRHERGSEDAVPPGFFSDEGNLMYSREGFETRRGFTAITGLSPTNVARIYEYRRVGEASRFIYCTGSGDFYDSLTPGTPILSLAGVSDFSMVVMFNRAYISPHNRVTGLTNEHLYLYDPGFSSTARLAAGLAPTATTLQATTGAPTQNDSIEAGVHLFAICFETDSGFITKPGLSEGQYVKHVAPGGRDVNLTGIQTGPAGTVARHILATKVLPGYQDGTQAYQNWYFLPNGRIPNNSTTSYQFSFFDVALQDSADEYLDLLEEIPSGVFLVDFDGRLCIGAPIVNRSTVHISKSGNPEMFSSLDGFVNVSPGDAGGGVTNGVAHRGTLYISKSQRFYATQDNGGSPSSWSVISVDSGIGTECFGISSVLDSRGHSRDQFLVAARSGLFQYLGAFNERELTWNIRDLWLRINQVYFNKVQVCVDPQREWIVVAVPLDAATENSHLFVGDYSEALELDGIKWSLWQMPKKPTSILIKVDDTTKKTKIVFGSSQNSLYEYDEAAYNDFGTKIESFFESHLFEPEGSAGQINHYAGIRLRLRGSGSLSLIVNSYDLTVHEDYAGVTLSATPGGELLYRTDFLSERASFRFTLAAVNQWFLVNRYTVFCRPMWTERAE